MLSIPTEVAPMNTILTTEAFDEWLASVKDQSVRGSVLSRINRAAHGNFGDNHDVGDGLWEMRIDKGPGYRLYYVRDGLAVYLMLGGGDKSSQNADIKAAKSLWTSIKQERK